MKKILSFVLLSAIVFSCHKEQDVQPKKGTLVFSLNSEKTFTGGRMQGTEKPASVLISIKDAQGNYVEQVKKLTLYNFGPSFTTESLDMFEGQYTVTDFLVIDGNNNVMYAAPKEGSDLANLVSNPLPLPFAVTNKNSTLVDIQVIEVSLNEPEKFGYVSFGFDVVHRDIALTFIASTNPFMVTRGYDSAIITFTSQLKTVRKKLTIISPVEARGSVSPTDLGISSNTPPIDWKVEVRAYYESIDEVPYNLHINEAIASVYKEILPGTTAIKFESDKASLNNVSGSYSTADLTWENWAHLTDDTGYFHLIVKNDICNPVFQYELKKDAAYYAGYFMKEVYTEGYDFYDMHYSMTQLTKGKYTDNTTFVNMCSSQVNEILYGTVSFLIDTETGAHDCYLVWMYKDTPIDPQHPDGPKTKMGGFQVKHK